jgi:hypothetical protein
MDKFTFFEFLAIAHKDVGCLHHFFDLLLMPQLFIIISILLLSFCFFLSKMLIFSKLAIRASLCSKYGCSFPVMDKIRFDNSRLVLLWRYQFDLNLSCGLFFLACLILLFLSCRQALEIFGLH